MRRHRIAFTLLIAAVSAPAPLSSQGLGQVGVRAVFIRTTDASHLIGSGAAVSYGLAGYKSLLLAPTVSVVRIDRATVPTVALDLVYTPARFLTAALTPYAGAEWDITGLPGTTVPGYVVFAGITINQQAKGRKTRSVFGQRGEAVPNTLIEGRVGQFVWNGRYHELDIGYVP